MVDQHLPREWVCKTAVIGAAGLLGSAFHTALRRCWPHCIGTDYAGRSRHAPVLDLRSPDITDLGLGAQGYRAALLLGAVTGVERCEVDKELTRAINVDGTLQLAGQLAAAGIRPIFASSDYVFDGRSGSYSDEAPPNPTTEYGAQKAQVEAQISEVTDGDYLVVRLSKIVSTAPGDGSLLDEMAGALQRGEQIRAAFDQVFCPTLVFDVVEAVRRLVAVGARGIVNVCAPERWSRYDIAVAVAHAMGVDSHRVSRISIDDLPGRARRPHDTSLTTARLQAECSCSFAPLSHSIARVAAYRRRDSDGVKS